MVSLLKNVQSFVFPPICCHCHKMEKVESGGLCQVCWQHLALLVPELRCPTCFHRLRYGQMNCSGCHNRGIRMAAAFDYFGPIVSLLHRFKYSGEFAIAKTFASFLILQLSKLRWERPDVIVPVPQTLSHLFLRGYNPPALIAYEMGKILGCQVLSPLRKKEDRLPQTFLDRKDRITLSEENFSWTKRCDLRDKVVLIVDDVMTTGATIRSVSVILKEECPLRIYGLAVCNNDTHYS